MYSSLAITHYTLDNKSTFTKTGTPRTPDITSDAEFIERQNLFTDFLNSPVHTHETYLNCVLVFRILIEVNSPTVIVSDRCSRCT